jgi:hypothetical protein
MFILYVILLTTLASAYANNCTIVSAGSLEFKIPFPCKIIECTDNPLSECYKYSTHAREGQAYTAYIVQHYDSLEGLYVFIHGHKNSWHHRLPILESLQHALTTKTFEGLNHIPIYIDDPSKTVFGTIWDNVLKPVIKRDMPKRICVDGSAQFAVHSSQIKRHSKEVWNELFAYVYGTKSWPNSALWNDRGASYAPGDFKGTSWFTEYAFGVMLGDFDCHNLFQSSG